MLKKGTDRGMHRWRAVALLTTGLAIGVTMMATPAGSHVGGTVGHLWNGHIKPRADARYANAVSGTDKAKDSNKLDGLDSSAFARGQVDVSRQIVTDINLGLHDVISIPGVGAVRAGCGFTTISFDYKNTSGAAQDVVQERAGTYAEFENVADGADTADTAASEPNGVTYHVATSGLTDNAIFIVHANIANGTAGPCAYRGTTVSSTGAGSAAAALYPRVSGGRIP